MLPVELWHLNTLGHLSQFQTIDSIFSTNRLEAMELLSLNFGLVIISISGVLWWATFSFFSFKNERNQSTSVIGIIGFTILLLVSAVLYIREYSIGKEGKSFSGVIRQYEKTFPSGTLIKLIDVIEFRIAQSKILKKYETLQYPKAFIVDTSEEYSDIFIIIGESSRADHWSIINPSYRETNPRLRKRNLVAVNNAYSPGYITAPTIPLIITDASIGDNLGSKAYKSLVPILNNIGFRTIWLTNQPMEGNPLIFTLQNLSDTCISISDSYTVDGNFDFRLLPELRKVASSPVKNKSLYVLHTMGQHFKYSHRFPNEYEIYKPSLSKNSLLTLGSSNKKEEIINAYDNSLIYTDHLTDSVISIALINSKNPLVVYFSDHGEVLFDSSYQVFGHAYDFLLKQQLNIPVLFWSKNYDNLASRLGPFVNQKDEYVSIDNLMETILWLMGVRYQGLEIDQTWLGNKVRKHMKDGINYIDANGETKVFNPI